ncbi:uncharacterized protein LOC111894012 [Lactuca sativa]|uniref:uncharacterized protein LOC111894012 n=1 Tax=Lactuca sativa TaxID=4236 RepID=UPI000CD8FE06|nr:uncharacterized protein LOC111894012 [Lactuca sativa]
MRAYKIKGESEEVKEREDKCFTAKPMGEQTNDCDQLIKKEDKVDIDGYNCESIVSSNENFDAYKIGLDKIELSSENKINVENTSEFDKDSDISEISVEDEVDCLEFVKSETEPTKGLISKNSVEFARMSQDKSKVLKQKVVVYQKIQAVLNQVYTITGVTQEQTAKLTALVNKDNASGCDDHFWSAPIDNADETVSLSKRTSWRVKGRYVVEPLNKPTSFDAPSTSGTKEIPSKLAKVASKTSSLKSETHAKRPMPRVNIHKSQKQLAEQKLQRKRRYQKNLNERKQFLKSKNSNYVRTEKASNLKEKARSKANSSLCIHCQSCSQTNKRSSFSPKFDDEWYIDSGCSRHMTGRREEPREFQALKDGGCVKYGNNLYRTIKGYGMITNEDFSIQKVAYVEGLQHNIISVSQLVVGTGLKVSYDDEGSEIIEKKTMSVLLKSHHKDEMYPLNLNPIRGKPVVSLLMKAHSDESWLGHRRLLHLNFKDINKLVLGDHVQGLPLLKFDKEHLCAACEMGKQSRKSHPTRINTKIIEPR